MQFHPAVIYGRSDIILPTNNKLSVKLLLARHFHEAINNFAFAFKFQPIYFHSTKDPMPEIQA